MCCLQLRSDGIKFCVIVKVQDLQEQACCNDRCKLKHTCTGTASCSDCRFQLQDVQHYTLPSVWALWKGEYIHPELSADAAYSACHAISQVGHQAA